MRAIILLLALAACAKHEPSPAEVAGDLEQQYHIMEDAKATNVEKCSRSAAVAEAYLQAHNSPKYDEWRQKSRTDCVLARMDASRPS